MDFVEKARIRLKHWLDHNENHLREYKEFADQLDTAGKNESGRHMKEMVDLATRANQCIRNALRDLD